MPNPTAEDDVSVMEQDPLMAALGGASPTGPGPMGAPPADMGGEDPLMAALAGGGAPMGPEMMGDPSMMGGPPPEGDPLMAALGGETEDEGPDMEDDGPATLERAMEHIRSAKQMLQEVAALSEDEIEQEQVLKYLAPLQKMLADDRKQAIKASASGGPMGA